MKVLFIVTVVLLVSAKSYADCGLGRMDFWPNGKTIYENSLIVIDGYSLSQKIILQLNLKYPVYLKSGDEKVELTVEEIIIGEGSLTQAILKPVKELIPGREYHIYIDNIPENQSPETKNWNSITGKYEYPNWKVIKGRDISKPKWVSKPKELKKTFIAFGCGPEAYVYFSFQASDQSEILIKTSVTSLASNKTTISYLKPEDNGVLKVGRGMCGGAFNFNEGDNFEVKFDIMDSSGNITRWTENKIAFTKPIESH